MKAIKKFLIKFVISNEYILMYSFYSLVWSFLIYSAIGSKEVATVFQFLIVLVGFVLQDIKTIHTEVVKGR